MEDGDVESPIPPLRRFTVVVPSGVTITGATNNGFPTATLLGQGSGVGLKLARSATLRNLSIGVGSGFATALSAMQGTQNLTNLKIGVPTTVTGATLHPGLDLEGSANATLQGVAAQTNTTGSTIFVNGGGAVFTAGSAQFTLRGGQIRLNASDQGPGAAIVTQSSQFTLDSAQVTGGSPNCFLSTSGVAARDTARVVLKNGAQVQNLEGSSPDLSDSAGTDTAPQQRLQQPMPPGASQTVTFQQTPTACS